MRQLLTALVGMEMAYRSAVSRIGEVFDERRERGASIIEVVLWASFTIAVIGVIGPILMDMFTTAAEDIDLQYEEGS